MTDDKPTSGLGSLPKRLQPKPVEPTGPDPFITGNHRTPDGRVHGFDKRAPLPGSRQEKALMLADLANPQTFLVELSAGGISRAEVTRAIEIGMRAVARFRLPAKE